MEREAFERLYEDHAQSLLRFLVYRTGDRALAEDLHAEAFERALRGRRGFDRRKASEKTWLYAIALNCVRGHARRRGAEERAYERTQGASPDAGEAPLLQVEDRADLAAALGRLSDEEREAVALRYGADLKLKEIARLSGESQTTVEGRVYRALRKLRAELEGG